MSGDTLLRLAFAANILILVPVVGSLLFGANDPTLPAFSHRATESAPLRLMLAALWGTILLASIAALWAPNAFVLLLIVQVIYKTGWLLSFVLPLVLAGRGDAVPWGVAGSFLFIVLVWPVLLIRSGALAAFWRGML
jgi:hypothetical protein